VTRGGDLSGDLEIRSIAFVAYREYRATGTFNNSDIGPLCRVVILMKPTPTVHTSNPSLETEMRETCPAVRARILVDSQ